MGLADLTGELMRNAINSLATGNTEVQLLPFPTLYQNKTVSLMSQTTLR